MNANEESVAIYQLLNFVGQQTAPLPLKTIQAAMWRFCRPPYELRHCIDHLIELEMLAEVVWIHGEPSQADILIGTPKTIEAFKAAQKLKLTWAEKCFLSWTNHTRQL